MNWFGGSNSGGSSQSIWGSISGFFSDAYSAVSTAYKDFSAGYEYGDESPGNQSWFYRAGDYVEDVFDLGEKAGKAYGFIEKATGADSYTAPDPRQFEVSASSYGNVGSGSYRATKMDYAKMGYADPRVQSAAAKIAQNNTQSFASTQRALGMTTRGGRLTMGINQYSSIDVKPRTRLPGEVA